VAKPVFQVISRDEVESIHHASMETLENAGLIVEDEDSLRLLSTLGAEVNLDSHIVKIPEYLVKEAVEKTPKKVGLYSRDGKVDALLEKNNVNFCPGSVALEIVDHEGVVRKPQSRDLLNFIKLVDALENLRIQSLSLYMWDIPESIVKTYGLYLALKNTTKPIVISAFTEEEPKYMKMLLDTVGCADFAEKPRVAGIVTASSPLSWRKLYTSSETQATFQPLIGTS